MLTDLCLHLASLGHNELKELHAIIGSGNGLLPVRHQALTWTIDDLLSIVGLLGKLQWKLIQNILIFSQENAFQNVVHKIFANFSHFVLTSMC